MRLLFCEPKVTPRSLVKTCGIYLIPSLHGRFVLTLLTGNHLRDFRDRRVLKDGDHWNIEIEPGREHF